MHDEYTRSDHWEKLKRASRRDASSRHNIPYSGKRGSPDKHRWGGKVRVSNDPDFDYSNEVGGLHSNERIYRHWGGKRDGEFSSWFATSWLEKQVGRPWDDVWSEICSRYDSRSYVGSERRKAFSGKKWYHGVVARCTYFSVDGNIRDNHYRHIVSGLYVHPETGILCNTEPVPSRKTVRRRKRVISDVIVVAKGGWFFAHESRWTKPVPCYYTYRLEDCGTYSKRADKNKIKAWFRCWDVTTSTPYWWTHHTQYFPVDYYLSKGYSKHDELGWGEWRWDNKTVHHKESCTRIQLAWIRKALAGTHPEAVVEKEEKERYVNRPRGGKKLC